TAPLAWSDLGQWRFTALRAMHPTCLGSTCIIKRNRGRGSAPPSQARLTGDGGPTATGERHSVPPGRPFLAQATTRPGPRRSRPSAPRRRPGFARLGRATAIIASEVGSRRRNRSDCAKLRTLGDNYENGGPLSGIILIS